MLSGWIEYKGKIITESDAKNLTLAEFSTCGGEFFISTDKIIARDCYGIMPADYPAGLVSCIENGASMKMTPDVPLLKLEDAIYEAVCLRMQAASVAKQKAVVTLSGGVDSTLVAAIATEAAGVDGVATATNAAPTSNTGARFSSPQAIAVGVEGSHDALAAEKAALALDIPLTIHTITTDEVEAALPEVAKLIPRKNPMDLELAVTGWFICSLAKKCGATQIITGQAADELFAGYARYSSTQNLRLDLEHDFAGLETQRARDSSIATHFGVWYSLPYMDERVVRVAKACAPDELVSGDKRKIALRRVAEKYIPEDFAWKEKKAMQYGSGISKIIRDIAKKNGCRNVAGLLEKIINSEEK